MYVARRSVRSPAVDSRGPVGERAGGWDVLLQLQRTVGNRAVQSVLGRRGTPGRSLARDIASIERHLGFRTSDPDDERLRERRRALRGDMGALDHADAFLLVGRLLEPVAEDVVAAGFQRLHRAVRRELLTILFARLRHVDAEGLHTTLTARPQHSWDRRLQRRFAELVPDATWRRDLLTLLSDRFAHRHAPEPGRPLWVRLEFRNRGQTSPDNTCASCPDVLGVHRASGRNGMELRGDIAGDGRGVKFDIKRTMEKATWRRVGNTWKQVDYRAPGTDDDRLGDHDEDLDGSDGHIYVMDVPGPYLTDPTQDPFHPADTQATGFYSVISFVEWVEADVAGTTQRVSEEFEWHTATTLTKRNGRWQRDWDGLNEIEAGPIPVLSPIGDSPKVPKGP